MYMKEYAIIVFSCEKTISFEIARRDNVYSINIFFPEWHTQHTLSRKSNVLLNNSKSNVIRIPCIR